MTAASSFWEVLLFNHRHLLINITHKISQHKRNHLLERMPGRSKVLCTGTMQHQRVAWERMQQAALQLNKVCVYTHLLGPGPQQWDTDCFGSSKTNTSTERGRERGVMAEDYYSCPSEDTSSPCWSYTWSCLWGTKSEPNPSNQAEFGQKVTMHGHRARAKGTDPQILRVRSLSSEQSGNVFTNGPLRWMRCVNVPNEGVKRQG